jgi:HlyD family secretion protein
MLLSNEAFSSELSPGRRGNPIGRARLGEARSVVAALLCLTAAPASAESTAQGTTVICIQAAMACIREEVRITGFAVAREQAGASLPAQGYRVTEVLVTEGERVTRDQEMLRAVRDEAADTPGAAQPASKATVPSSMSLRAPISGTVTRISARVGSFSGAPTTAGAVQQDPQLFIEGDAGVELIADVPSLFAAQIRKSAKVLVSGNDGIEIRGIVRMPVSDVDPATQLGRARIAIEPVAALRPGQFASAVIETASECGITVPRSAIYYQNGVAMLQVVNNGAIEPRSVRTGLSNITRIGIREGLSEGQAVVANADTALRSGDRVKPVMLENDGRARTRPP